MTILPPFGRQSLPSKTELQLGWEDKLKSHKFIKYAGTIKKGLMKLGKYYSKFDDKPVYILMLSELAGCWLHDGANKLSTHMKAHIKHEWSGRP